MGTYCQTRPGATALLVRAEVLGHALGGAGVVPADDHAVTATAPVSWDVGTCHY
jgi:hypothetical protein